MPTTDRSKLNPYHRPLDVELPNGEWVTVWIDLYDILDATRKDQDGNYRQCRPSDAAFDHGIKKLLYAGLRGGGKSVIQDLEEGLVSIREGVERSQ
jgi:hypothetical protein